MYRYIFSLLFFFHPFGIILADPLFIDSGITYQVTSDSTVNIIAQNDKRCSSQIKDDSLLLIPASIIHKGKTYNVECIEKEAFMTWCGIKSVIISNGVKDIQDAVFSGCANLESVSIPASIKTIGKYVFNYCIKLDSIIIDINNSVFDSRNGCNAIIRTANNTLLYACNSTIIPSSVESICSFAYTGLTMKVVSFPDGLKEISEYAIYNCDELEKIYIPFTVEDISPKSFFLCNNVKTISIDNKNEFYDSRNNCNAIIDKHSGILIWGCSTTKIPSGLSKIGEYAFIHCEKLYTITIPEGIEHIGQSAFWGCTALKHVEIPSSLVSFDGYSHFAFCTSLDSLFIPQNVNHIPSDIFSGCISLERIVVDKRNKYYDSRENCNAIVYTANNEIIAGCKKTTIVEGIKSISASSFYKTGLTSIHIPSSIEHIDSTAFRENEYCKTITVDNNNIKFKSDNSNSIIEKHTGRMILACSTTNILPEVTHIGGFAYVNTPRIIILPSSIKTIGYAAFANSDLLVSIIIPSSVKTIGRFAFANCKHLLNVVLMSNNTFVDKNAFEGCDLLNMKSCK